MNDEITSMDRAIQLWLAGWTSELPKGCDECPVMSWRWRAPAKLYWRNGRFYRSTHQAWTAMQRQQQTTT